MNKYILIVQDFGDALYPKFIDLMFEYSTSFSLIRMKGEIDVILEQREFVNKLKPYLIRIDMDQKSWPGTPYGVLSDVYHYKATKESLAILKTYTNSMFKSFNSLLGHEDLAFYIGNKCWLYSTSHENYCEIYPENESILKEIRELRYMSPYALIREKETKEK